MKIKTFVAIAALLMSAFAAPAVARVPRDRILFSSFDGFSTGLRSIKPNGEGRRTLSRGEHTQPRWSPDRTQIAFATERRGAVRGLFVMDRDGTNKRRVADYGRGFTGGGFDWSPDGTRIVYAYKVEEAAQFDFFVVDVGTRSVTRLTETDGDEREPDWSPDGQHIAYTGNPVPDHESGEGDNEDVYVMGSDGASQTRLTEHDADDYMPQWSPDASRIAFVSGRDDYFAEDPDIGVTYSEIYVVDPSSGAETRVTDHAVHKDSFEWSPDGTRFAYLGRCDNDQCEDRETDVYAVNADGTGRRNLTSDARFESSNEIEWSPDGTWVAYALELRGGRSQDIAIADASGSHMIKRVTTSGRRAEAHLDW